MRHFSITAARGTKFFYKWQEYILRLDSELQSIADFINWQNPNYQILNYTPGTNTTYYSYEELINKGYIREVYFYDAQNEAPVTSQNLQPNTLLVFPANLSFHQGVINNFKPLSNSKGTFLCFFAFEYLKEFLANRSEVEADSQALWILPDTLLINGLDTEVTRWVPVDYVYSWDENLEIDITNSFATSGVDYAWWRAVSGSQEETEPKINPLEKLDVSSFIFNQYRIISYENTQKLTADSRFIPFKEAFFVVSLARAEDNLDSPLAPVRLDPKNYLYCRMAGGSPYYLINGSDFDFQRKGSINFGNNNIFILAANPIRVAYSLTWPQDTTALGFLSYIYSPWEVSLGNKNGIPWTGYHNLNHHISLYTYKETSSLYTSEEIFTENSSEVGFTNIDKNKIPYYTININEGANLKNIETKNSSLDISIW